MQALYQLSYNPEGTPNIEKYCLVVKGEGEKKMFFLRSALNWAILRPPASV